jgi:hypothetical protein
MPMMWPDPMKQREDLDRGQPNFGPIWATKVDVRRAPMKSLMATMVAVAIAPPAGAQGVNLLGGMSQPKTDVEFRQEKEREQSYKSGISKIPDAKAKIDPWGNIRSPATSQPAQNPQRPASR